MKYESEILYDLMKRDGLLNPSQDNLPYESELKEEYIAGVKGAYPKLTDYQAEWLNYAYNEQPIGEFPYVALTDVTNATIENVVPYAYKSAILKGCTLVNLCDKTKSVISESKNKNIWRNALFNTNPTQLTVINYTDKVIKFGVHNRTNNDWVATNGVNPNSKRLVNCGTDNYLKDLYGAYGDGWSDTEEDRNILKNGVLVLEGDYTQEDIPYFEGMKSVQMPVLTTSNEDGTKSNILTVNEEVVLCRIGDIKDELNCLTGEVTQRIGEMVLDGSERWETQTEKTNTRVFKTIINSIKNIDKHIISDRFPSNVDGDVEKITNISTEVYVAILRTKADNLNDFKSYLSQNPLTIQYPRTKESIKTVELTMTNQNGESLSKMTPIEGTMNLTTSSDTIAPTFSGEIPVEAIEQNLSSFVHLEGVEENE